MVSLVAPEVMPTWVTGMHSKGRPNAHAVPLNCFTAFAKTNMGFTLIEILVVILIVGITLSFALMAFGDFGEKRRIVISAEQFSQYVKLAQQQAILETTTLGIGIHKNGYQVMRLSPKAKWLPMSSNSIFHEQHFPKGLLINLQNNASSRGNPSIIIDSSGDMTAFTLTFGSAKQPSIVSIIGEHNGALHTAKSP